MPFHSLRLGGCRGFALVSHTNELLMCRVTTKANRYIDAALGTSNKTDSVKDYQTPVNAQKLVDCVTAWGRRRIIPTGGNRGVGVGRPLQLGFSNGDVKCVVLIVAMWTLFLLKGSGVYQSGSTPQIHRISTKLRRI